MTLARDIAHIRKLCGLPLPAQSLAQAVLPALRKLVPAHSGGVFWVDEHGEMSSLFAERLLPPDAMATYYEKHYATARVGFVTAFQRRAALADPVSFHSFTPAEQGSEYFRDVLRTLDAYHVLYAILQRGTRPIAQVSLYRGAADPPFDDRAAATLRSLLHYLAAGFGRVAQAAVAGEASVVVEEELGIVAESGALLSATERWHRLLRLLVVGEVSPRAARGEAAAIEGFLRGVCAGIGRDDRAGSPREVQRDTPWGRFIVRAFLLADARGGRGNQFGLLIRREESRSMSLVRGTGATQMSPQQREVALRLAEGLTNREIADALGLSLNTASYHVKQVYARLGVNDRNAVAATLLALAGVGD